MEFQANIILMNLIGIKSYIFNSANLVFQFSKNIENIIFLNLTIFSHFEIQKENRKMENSQEK